MSRFINSFRVADWLSGCALVSINEVTLRRTRLVLGWATVCGRVNHLSLWPVTQANSAFYPASAGRKMSTGQNAVTLCCWRVMFRYGSFHLWINVWVTSKTVWSLFKHVIPERLRGELLLIKCYTNRHFTSLYGTDCFNMLLGLYRFHFIRIGGISSSKALSV